MRAFISYSRADQEFLRSDVLPALRAVGVSAWLDTQDMIAGDSWIQSVIDEIQHGDWLLIVFTEEYSRSVSQRTGPCYQEMLWMVDSMSSSRSPGRLIVIWRAGQLPELLKQYHAIDARDDTGRLLEMLRAAAEKDRSLRKSTSAAQAPPAVSIARPQISDPRDLPDLARYNFDLNASRYASGLFAGKSMQSGNAESLLRLVARHYQERGFPTPDSWVDIGCGPGLVAWVADERRNLHRCTWLTKCHTRIGFDYAPALLAQMPPWIRQCYTHIFEGDLRTVDSTVLAREAKVSKVDLLLANNVFHWLFTREAIDSAFRRCYEVLTKRGCLAASIAGIGTARDFITAYKAEMEEVLEPALSDRWRRHLQNPIGLQSLDDIVDIARRNHFIVDSSWAYLAYEPVLYGDGTDEYVEDARSYGEEVFMAPLLNKPRTQREEIWSRIKSRFRQICDARSKDPGYVHDQYMIYLIARRGD
jgi:trans-aconitate methyltransferase